MYPLELLKRQTLHVDVRTVIKCEGIVPNSDRIKCSVSSSAPDPGVNSFVARSELLIRPTLVKSLTIEGVSSYTPAVYLVVSLSLGH